MSPSVAAAPDEGPLAIICGGGSLPFAVADAATERGRRVKLFAVRGWADPERVVKYPHHWIVLGKFGWFCRVARAEEFRDIVLIGTLSRPSIRQIGLDFGTLRVLPGIIAAFRGGDDHLLSGLVGIMERYGFRLLAPHEVAPEILVPAGPLGRRLPSEQERSDIIRGLALLDAIGKFDVGQAAVIAGNRVLAVEASEGTDHMLARVADMRSSGKIRAAAGGVLVKAPKRGQDWRFDLPSIGPRTIEGIARAGLAGIAVLAEGAIIAEPQQVAAAAEARDVFVVGVRSDGTFG